MPFVPLPNGIQAVLKYTQKGQELINVLHLLGNAPFDATGLIAIATDIATWWVAEMKPLTATDVTLHEIDCRAMDSESAPAINFTSTPLPSTGTASGSLLPNSVTPCITLRTGLAGRSFRGRFYAPGPTQSAFLSGNTDEWTSDYRTALVAAMNALRDFGWTILGTNLVVVSRFHNKAPRTTAVATPVASITMDATVDSQRRRLEGRGR